MKPLWKTNVFGWRMTGILGNGAEWFAGFSRRPPEPKWEPPFAESKELLQFINKTPLVQSLLYDINLMPEEITDPLSWAHMLAVCGHMKAALSAGMAGRE